MVDSALSNIKTYKELENELKMLIKKKNDVNFNLKNLGKQEKAFM